MAGDGLQLRCDTIVNTNGAKVSRASDGSLIGVCGDAADGIRFCDWYERRLKDPTLEPPSITEFGALVLKPDGQVFYYHEPSFTPIPLPVPAAAGSGSPYALAAMDAGVSPERAVQIAIERDPYSGGSITVLHLSDTTNATKKRRRRNGN